MVRIKHIPGLALLLPITTALALSVSPPPSSSPSCFDGSNRHFTRIAASSSSGAAEGEDEGRFQFCQKIHDDLFLYYTPEFADSDKVLVGFHAVTDTFGWTALAIGGNGGMKGASQIVVRKIHGNNGENVGEIDESNSTWVVEDRNSQEYTTPSLDESQDLELVFAEQTDDGETAWGVLLPMYSCDDLDYIIHNISRPLHWAFGEDHSFSYHGRRRGQFYANLLQAPKSTDSLLNLDPTVGGEITTTMDLVMPNVSTSPSDGRNDPVNPFLCTYIDLDQVYLEGGGDPQKSYKDKLHITSFEPVLSEETKHYVHHIFLFSCSDESYGERHPLKDPHHHKVIHRCTGMRVACRVPVMGWVNGITSETYPENVGVPIGEGSRWLLMQVHYYNPGLDDIINDSSGLRAYIAQDLRTYDAGLLGLGGAITAYQQLDPLPGGEKHYAMSPFVVPSGCTYTMWEEPINIFKVLHHQHLFGTHMEIEARRYGKSLGTLRDEKRYDFIHQSLEEPLIKQLFPGDEIILRCQYDTSTLSKNDSVAIGLGTDDEMCLGIISYWPRQKWESLLSVSPNTVIEPCQAPGSGHLFANASRCAQDFFEDPARTLAIDWDYEEHFDAHFMCNSPIHEDMIPRGLTVDLCPKCYVNKNCSVEEVAAYSQKFCKDICLLKGNISVYPDVSRSDGFNRGIQGCAGDSRRSGSAYEVRFFNAPKDLEPSVSSCGALPTKVDALESDEDDVQVWKLVIFTIFGLMASAVVLLVSYHLLFVSKDHLGQIPGRSLFSSKWTYIIQSFGGYITSCLCWVARQAAMHPRACVAGTIVLSTGLLLIGLGTKYTVEISPNKILAPAGSKPEQHSEFIESTYQNMPRSFSFIVHKQGSNVLSQVGVSRVFEALDVVRDSQGYSEVCQQSSFGCKIHGVTKFWNHSLSSFESIITSDEDLIAAMSEKTFPDGSPVDIRGLLGYPQWSGDGTQLMEALSYSVNVELLPESTSEGSSLSPVYDFEKDAIEKALELRRRWEQEGGNNGFHLEIWATRSTGDEVQRAVDADMALVPIGFCIMVMFVCFVFSKHDAVESQSLLGLGAVVSVILAMFTGFGLLFVTGVPLTSMTLLLSFIILGIGLDDAFVIAGSFRRMNQDLGPIERIDRTIRDVGLTIAATTVTSVLAFCLGTLSSIPGVDWLCYYAIPTLIIDFLYQITFFVALIVIDENRIMSFRRDCCFCFSVSAAKDDSDPGIEEEESRVGDEDPTDEPWSERIMSWYAARLLQGRVKALVLISFTALFVGLAYSASLLTQDFNLKDLLPSDSYLVAFSFASKTYSSRYASVAPHLYFRGVDQSNQDVQRQMEEYVNEMVDNVDAIEDQPAFFWLRHFRKYSALQYGTSFEKLTFQDKLKKFLEEPVFKELYSDSGDIVLDEDGNILSSRVLLFMSPHQEDISIPYLIDLLAAQRGVSKSQPINRKTDDWNFFAYQDTFHTWEFYSRIFDELLFASALCVLSVTAASMVFIPHWSGAFFIFPVLVAVYVDLLGFLQLVGVTMNPTSFIAMIIGIGLMVDYNLHILLRYYECKGSRNERVRETLRTLGSSVLLGAVTTLLGIVPAVFGATEGSKILFYSFIGLVGLGALHGLVLLPVLLSLLGPEGEADGPPSDGPPSVASDALDLANPKDTDMTRSGSSNDSEPGRVVVEVKSSVEEVGAAASRDESECTA